MKADMAGRRYGRLVAIEEAGRIQLGGGRTGIAWLFRCDCGAEPVLAGQRVRAGNTRSCGCLRRERTAERGRSQPHVIEQGHRHGHLTVISPIEDDRRGRRYLCRCRCGAEVERRTQQLRTGTLDCGCGSESRRREAQEARLAERRQRLMEEIGYATVQAHPLYSTWVGMHQRCSQPNHRYYDRYGGRGITVVDEWTGPGGFQQFLFDVGERPADPPGWSSTRPYWTLDRIHNDGSYQPSNVRWASPSEQAQGRAPRRTAVSV